MLKRRLSCLALVACLQAGALAAQDRAQLGLLPQAGDAAQSLPEGGKYTVGSGPSALSGSAKLPSTLEHIDQPEAPLRLRGNREIELYRTLAPSVALILTDEAEGSASLIATKPLADGKRSGVLLTSAHVVGDAKEVAVIFKPQKDGEKISNAQAVVGRVRKLDPVHDLALIEVESLPARVAAIPLGSMGEAQVGADVHAIGHPQGYTWTYTKGLIS